MPITRELLADVLNWKRISLKMINKHLKKIGPMLDLPFDLHTKIFRKTAGIQLLLYYEDIYLVQKAMAHQSIVTTQRYYVALPPEVVTKAMRRKKETDEQKLLK
jgi:integrase